MNQSAITLAVIPGADDQQRILVQWRHDPTGSHLQLQQQSWGEGVGWFTQSNVQLEPDQIAAVRSALGSQSECVSRAIPDNPAPRLNIRVIHAESA